MYGSTQVTIDGFSDGFVILLFFCAIICGGLSARLAKAKNLDPWTWFFAGLLFGLFGLIAVAGMPENRKIIHTVAISDEAHMTLESVIHERAKLRDKIDAKHCAICGSRFGSLNPVFTHKGTQFCRDCLTKYLSS